MPDQGDVYRRLQKHLDDLPIAYPATASGVELSILKRLFTPEEAEVALGLNAVPEPVEKIHRRVPGHTERGARADPRPDGREGRDLRRPPARERRGKRYSRAPLAIGMYEAQVDRLTKELQQDFEQYAREGFAAALVTGKTKQMRTIPVNARFVPDRLVGRYDDARRLIEEGAGPWAARNCVCRQGKDLLGEPCQQTTSRRVCLMIGPAARTSVASGDGQALTREETFALLDQAERDGMVLQPSNARDPVFICFCCGCCCGMLKAAKQFPRPAEYLQSNYHAVVDSGALLGVRDLPRALPDGGARRRGRGDGRRPRPLHRLRRLRPHLPDGRREAAGEGAGDRPAEGPEGALREDHDRALRPARHGEEDRQGAARPPDLTSRGGVQLSCPFMRLAPGIAAMLLVPALRLAAQAPRRRVFPSGVGLVEVPVIVCDRAGPLRPGPHPR